MGRACCFDVGLDGARHLAYACWEKKEEAFISWRVFPIWQVKTKRGGICHIHAIIFRKNMLSNYAYIHNPLLHIYATYYTDLFSYTHARTPKSNRLHSHGHTPIYHSLHANMKHKTLSTALQARWEKVTNNIKITADCKRDILTYVSLHQFKRLLELTQKLWTNPSPTEHWPAWGVG